MKMHDVDVCVIGGGFAGLNAAGHLSSNGLNVVLIEARDRLGGRILTEFSGAHPDLPIELGAEFIHGRHPGLYKFAREHGLRITEMGGSTYRHSERGLTPVNSQDDSEISQVLESDELLRQDQSFKDFVNRSNLSERAKAWIVSYVEGFNAAPSDDIGTKALYHQQLAGDRIDGDHSWRLDSGYVSFLRLLQNQVQPSAHILLNTIANKLEWKRGLVRVTATSERSETVLVTARSVIVTVPLGVLLGGAAISTITFDPELAMLRDLKLLASGAALRLNLVLSEPVWQDAAPDAGFILSQQAYFPTWWTRSSETGYLVTGWNGGPRAETLTGQSKNELVDLALASLSKILSIDIAYLRSKLEAVHYHDWQSDPFSRGSYAYVRMGGFEFSQRISQPIDKTVWFAGEAMASDGYWGTVHGAIESGRRAAVQVMSML